MNTNVVHCTRVCIKNFLMEYIYEWKSNHQNFNNNWIYFALIEMDFLWNRGYLNILNPLMHGIWQNMIFFWLKRRKIKLGSNISFGSCLLYASIRVQQFPYINLFRQDYYSSTEKSLNRPEIQFESEIMLETECRL